MTTNTIINLLDHGSIKVGDTHTFSYTVPGNKAVPDLFPESEEFTAMPRVFATGFFVGLIEWACMDHLKASLPEGAISLGVGVDITHDAPATEGALLEITVEVTGVGKRSVAWSVEVTAGETVQGRGTHKRVVVDREQFTGTVNKLAEGFGARTI